MDGRGAGSVEQAGWSRGEQDERALRRLGPLLDREGKHIAVAHDRLANQDAVDAGHSGPDDGRLLAFAKAQMSRGRFRIIKGLEDRVCFRIDQRHNRPLAEGRGDFELRLAAVREGGRTALVGCPPDAIEGHAEGRFSGRD
jgi:hypothetical protein